MMKENIRKKRNRRDRLGLFNILLRNREVPEANSRSDWRGGGGGGR